MSIYVQQVGGSIIPLLNIFVYQQNCLDIQICLAFRKYLSLAITSCTAERFMSWCTVVKKLKEQIAYNDA